MLLHYAESGQPSSPCDATLWVHLASLSVGRAGTEA